MPMLGTQKQLLLAIIATSDNMEETREDLERIMLSTIYIYIYIVCVFLENGLMVYVRCRYTATTTFIKSSRQLMVPLSDNNRRKAMADLMICAKIKQGMNC